jgi:hypothetical protein
MPDGTDCGITVIPKVTRLLMKKPITKEPKTTSRLNTPIVPLHIPLQAIKDARSALPPMRSMRSPSVLDKLRSRRSASSLAGGTIM